MRPLRLVLAFAVLLVPRIAASCPAIPFPVEVTQPGGKPFEVEVIGDEYSHFVREVATGYTVIQSEDGNWWYAESGPNGQLAPSRYRVGEVDPATAGLPRGLEPSAPSLVQPGISLGEDPHLAPASSRKNGSWNLPPTTKIIALMCQFSGTSGINTQPYWNSMLFAPSSSLADYYDEVSYGQYTVTGAVQNWQTLPHTIAEYDSDPTLWSRMIADAVAAFDGSVDFSQYDGDGDGLVDHLLLICAGDDPSDGSGTGIWPHMSWNASSVPTNDGVSIGSYFQVDDYTFAGDHRANLGTVCHEFGHDLVWPMGFGDIYDADGGSMGADDLNNYPVKHWCLMGDGNWSGPSTSTLGTVPAHLSGFHRMLAGWITPTTITTDGARSLSPIEGTTGTRLYKIPIASKPQEFFLLEFRKPVATAAYDRYSHWCSYGGNYPRLDPGLLVTHVDSTMWAKAAMNKPNAGTNTYASYSVEVVDSGFQGYTLGSTCPDTVITYNETRTSAPFSSEDGTPSMTSPLSDCFDGSPSGVSLSAIGSGAGSTISFTLARTNTTTEKRLLLYDDSFPAFGFYSALGMLRAVKFRGPSRGSSFNIDRAYFNFLGNGFPGAFKLHVMNGDGSSDLITPFSVPVTFGQSYPLWREVDLSSYPALHGLAPGTEFRIAVEYTSSDVPLLCFDPFPGTGRSYNKPALGAWQLSTYNGGNVDYLIRADVTTSGIVSAMLADFQAKPVNGAVQLDWSIANSVNHVGFRVYRAVGDEDAWQVLNGVLVRGVNGRYTYRDATVSPGQRYRYRLGEVDRSGIETAMGLVEIEVPQFLPPAISLVTANPNPAAGAARIELETTWAGVIHVDIFDLSGRRIRALVDRKVPGGQVVIDWDGRDDAGQAVGSGVYLVRARSGDQVESEKLTILR